MKEVVKKHAASLNPVQLYQLNPEINLVQFLETVLGERRKCQSVQKSKSKPDYIFNLKNACKCNKIKEQNSPAKHVAAIRVEAGQTSFIFGKTLARTFILSRIMRSMKMVHCISGSRSFYGYRKTGV